MPDDGQGRPRPTVGDIARAHGEAFKKQHALSEMQRKALRDVGACRTSVLGGRVDVCAGCGDEKAVFHSCRNRHCPGCQALTQARWVEGRMARLLPTDYFHVVFTVPDDLVGGLALRNRELFFAAMFSAGSQTLLTLGEDEKRLGAQLGLTAVLHTWTRDLRFHPHLHCIVTGGGLTRDGASWKASKQDYLFPVRVLSALFRGKLVAALDAAFHEGRLNLAGVDGFGGGVPNDVAWKRLRRKLYRTKWVSYAKPPFAGPEVVYQYLGRYTHRVGLSNHRLVSVTDDAVTFRTWGEDTATLHPHEFLRRFLQHVLPHGFVKLRHYGLLAPGNVNTKLVAARELLKARATPPPVEVAPPPAGLDKPADWRELLLRLTGLDVTRCSKCGGALYSRPLDRAAPKDTS
ncbi:MAG: putative transposase [Limisphaerales bacterium]|nr:MAG: putative transposase [Limisphaerales bacterium]